MSKIQIPPRFGPWQETMMGAPGGTEFVLGFYPDHPCVNTKVVYCVLTCVGNHVESEDWFDIDSDPVYAPVCWAAIIYPGEDE
jgi:hypothetical protein